MGEPNLEMGADRRRSTGVGLGVYWPAIRVVSLYMIEAFNL